MPEDLCNNLAPDQSMLSNNIFSCTTPDYSTAGGLTTSSDDGLIGLLSGVHSKSTNFLKENLYKFTKSSLGKRSGMILKKTVVSGLLALRGKDKVCTMYKLRKVGRSIDETSEEDVWLGTMSNRAASVDPKWFSTQSLGNVLCVVNTSEIPKVGDIPSGPVIDKSEDLLKDFFHNDDGDLIDNEDKTVVRLPAALLMPNGYESFKTGVVSQVTYDAFDRVEDPSLTEGPTFYSFWVDAINEHSPQIQETLLNEDELKKYIPAKPNTGHDYIDSPFVKFHSVDMDDELLSSAAEEMRKECESIAESALRNRIEATTPASGHSPRRSAGEASLGSSELSLVVHVPKKTYKNSEEDHWDSRVKAWLAHYDPTTHKVTAHVPTMFAPLIRDAGSKENKRNAVHSSLESIQETLSQEENFLYRQIDLPVLSKLPLSYLGQATFSYETVESLDVTTSVGFLGVMMFPDTPAMAKIKADTADINVAEEALGEHENKKTKMDTSFTTISEITGLSSLLAWTANDIALFRMYATFDLTQASGSTPPSMVKYIHDMTLKLTSLSARRWFKKNKGIESLKLLYYVMHQILTIMGCHSRASKDVLVLACILRDDFERAPKSHYRLAYEFYSDAMRQIDKVILGGGDVPSSPLWNSAPAKARSEEKENRRMLLLFYENNKDRFKDRSPGLNNKDRFKDRSPGLPKSGERDNKRQKTGKEGGGYLTVKTKHLNLPGKCFNAKSKLCKSNARTDIECPWGDSCTNDHTHFNHLPRDQQKALVKAFSKNDNVEFVGVDESIIKSIHEELAKE